MQIWKTVKVFLSSTFLDLEVERDQLADVFYRIKQELSTRQLSLIPYDLRWREIPNDIQEQKRYSKWCIEMLLQCQYFIGILGTRYGWRPDQDSNGQDNVQRISITEMEFREAYHKLSNKRRFFCFLSDKAEKSAQASQISLEDRESLAKLKNFIQQAGETILEYQTPQELPNLIYTELRRRLDQEFPPTISVELEQYTSRQALEELIAQKTRGFVGRDSYIQHIQNFVTPVSKISIQHSSQSPQASQMPPTTAPLSPPQSSQMPIATAPLSPPQASQTSQKQAHYLAILATAGTGKSALLAKWIQKFRAENHHISLAIHFMSMSADSRSLSSVIRHLAQQLEQFNILPSPLSDDIAILRSQLREVLEKTRIPLVIAIDGLDEIEEDGQDLSWLPYTVSEYVKIIITVRPVAIWDILVHLPQISILELPPLTDNEITTIIQSYIQSHNLQLSVGDQQLLEKRAQGNPLFLKVALEEMVESGIAVGQLAVTIDRLFDQIIQRLQKRYGKKMIEDYLGFLSASRAGLTESELQELLSQEQYQTMRQYIVDEALLAANHALDNFIVKRAGLCTFFHPEFERSIKERIGKGDIRRFHHALANYFQSKGYSYQRTLFELPYQYQWGIQHAELLILLTNLEFLKAKAQAGLADDLLEDFRRATSDHAEIKLPTNLQVEQNGVLVNRRTLELLHNAIQLDLPFLKRHPNHLFQCLWNRGYWYDAPECGQYYETASKDIPPWQSTDLKLYPLMEAWRNTEESRGLVWIKSCKPLEVNLDTPLLKILRGHEGWVPSVAMSPDGRLFVSASHDETIKVWNIATGECLKVLKGHTNKITRVLFCTPQYLVSSAEDCTIRIWQLDPDRCIKVIPAHSQSIEALAIHPQSHLLASGAKDHIIKLWNLQTGASIGILAGHENEISALAFSPDGRFLISGSADLGIKVWDVSTQECIRTLTHHRRRIYDICFSRDGKKFAVASRDDTASLWDAETFQVQHTLVRHKWGVLSLDFSPDGNKLLTGSGDKTIALWDTNTGECLKVFLGHERTVSTVKFSPDGKTFVSGSYDRSVRIWNAQSRQCTLALKGHEEWARVAVLSPNSQLIASGSTDKQIYLWDGQTGQMRQKLSGHTGWITTLTFSPDNLFLASGGGDNTIRLWNISTGQCLCVLQGHTEPILAIQYLPDGKHLLSGSRDATIRLWDTETGQCLKILRGHQNWISSLDYHAGSDLVVSGSHDTTIKLWNLSQGQCIHTIQTIPPKTLPIPSNGEPMTSAPILPVPSSGEPMTSPPVLPVPSSGEPMTSAPINSDQTNAQISNFQTNTAIENDLHIRSVAFSQDGRQIISANRGQQITIWDIITKEKIAVINGDVETHQMAGIWPYYLMILDWTVAVVTKEQRTPVAFFSELITSPKIGTDRKITGVSQGAYVYLLKLQGIPQSR